MSWVLRVTDQMLRPMGAITGRYGCQVYMALLYRGCHRDGGFGVTYQDLGDLVGLDRDQVARGMKVLRAANLVQEKQIGARLRQITLITPENGDPVSAPPPKNGGPKNEPPPKNGDPVSAPRGGEKRSVGCRFLEVGAPKNGTPKRHDQTHDQHDQTHDQAPAAPEPEVLPPEDPGSGLGVLGDPDPIPEVIPPADPIRKTSPTPIAEPTVAEVITPAAPKPDQPQQLGLLATSPQPKATGIDLHIDGIVDRCLALWHELWGIRRIPGTKTEQKRRKLLMDKLAEGYPEDAIMELIRGHAGSQFHRDNGHTDIEYALRDTNESRFMVPGARQAVDLHTREAVRQLEMAIAYIEQQYRNVAPAPGEISILDFGNGAGIVWDGQHGTQVDVLTAFAAAKLLLACPNQHPMWRRAMRREMLTCLARAQRMNPNVKTWRKNAQAA